MELLTTLLPVFLQANLGILAQAATILGALPWVMKLVVLLWVTWIMYLAYTSLERAFKLKKAGLVAKVLAAPLVIIFWPLDVIWNATLLSVVFWEWPRELTMTARLGRHHRESTGYRYKVAKWMGAELLDPFDFDGHHIDPDPRKKG